MYVLGILCLERILHMCRASWLLQCLGDLVFRIHWFVWQIDDLILRFVNSSNVCATVVIDCPKDLSEGCDLQVFFANNLYVLIGPPCGSVFLVLSWSYFHVLHLIHRLTLTSDRLLLSNNITRCIIIIVNYADSV